MGAEFFYCHYLKIYQLVQIGPVNPTQSTNLQFTEKSIQMSLEVGICGTHQHHLIHWIKTMGILSLTCLLISFTKVHRHYRNNNKNNTVRHKVIDFEQILWPKLKEKLCPRGVPKTELGPSLFELGRIEFGLEPNATANPKNRDWTLRSGEQRVGSRERTVELFYDGDFAFTVFLDGNDPTNTLFYAPIWKCAHNQIQDYLNKLFDRKGNGQIRDVLKQQKDYYNDTYLKDIDLKELEYMFHEELERPKDKKEKGSYFTYNDTSRTKPCVFTVLRDPISHFLSGYNECEVRLIKGFGGAPQLSEESHSLASYTKIPYDEGPEKREERFQTFVKNLLKEHPSFSAFHYYKHFASMSRILPTLSRFDLLPHNNDDNDNDEKAQAQQHDTTKSQRGVWFLPTIENITDTFPTFLADHCPSMACNYQQRQEKQKHNDSYDLQPSCNQARLPSMRSIKGHESSQDKFGIYKAAKDVWKRGGPLARSLCVLHVFDYACFGLDIPRVCKKVYASNRFVERILSNK